LGQRNRQHPQHGYTEGFLIIFPSCGFSIIHYLKETYINSVTRLLVELFIFQFIKVRARPKVFAGVFLPILILGEPLHARAEGRRLGVGPGLEVKSTAVGCHLKI
jgi:hypothetical protein